MCHYYYYYFSVLDPDGKFRTVKYTADKLNGFQASIITDGHVVHHPQDPVQPNYHNPPAVVPHQPEVPQEPSKPAPPPKEPEYEEEEYSEPNGNGQSEQGEDGEEEADEEGDNEYAGSEESEGSDYY